MNFLFDAFSQKYITDVIAAESNDNTLVLGIGLQMAIDDNGQF